MLLLPLPSLLQEACRRHLGFTVPRVVAVSPQMRLVEDNTSNLTLSDIFKQVHVAAQVHVVLYLHSFQI